MVCREVVVADSKMVTAALVQKHKEAWKGKNRNLAEQHYQT